MARLDTTCPECGAPHARKLSAIHADGLTNVQTNVETVGKLNTIGRHQIKTKGTIQGTQQTDASKRAAPPVEPVGGAGKAIKNAVCAIGAIVSVVFLVGNVPIGVVFGVALILIGIFLPVEVSPGGHEEKARREAEHKRAMDEWNSTFECGACSHRFVPAQSQAA